MILLKYSIAFFLVYVSRKFCKNFLFGVMKLLFLIMGLRIIFVILFGFVVNKVLILLRLLYVVYSVVVVVVVGTFGEFGNSSVMTFELVLIKNGLVCLW